MKLKDYILRWQEVYDKNQSRPTTYAAHGYIFKNHILPGLGDIPLSELTVEQVGDFLEERRLFGGHRLESPEYPGLGEHTMRHIHRLLQQCLDQAMRDGLIAENPARAFHYPKPKKVSANVLPDGTKVWLNSSSSVEYVAPFFSRQRRVKMEGEAYFEVEHDRRAPFVVSTNGLDIEVLGTRFNIRNDDNEHRVTTVLLEGAVKAYASGREQASVRLHPAQQLVFDTRTHAMRLTDCPSAERSINWIDGRFCFEHDTFGEIVAELKRYYNVDIRFMDNRLRDMRFSGNFRVEDGIYHIMSVLQLTYKFNYRIAGNDIELYANPER